MKKSNKILIGIFTFAMFFSLFNVNEVLAVEDSSIPVVGDTIQTQIEAQNRTMFTFRSRTRIRFNASVDIDVNINDVTNDSYLMISPNGKFFQNSYGEYYYSDSILEIGIGKAFEEIKFSFVNFKTRGADYYRRLMV